MLDLNQKLKSFHLNQPTLFSSAIKLHKFYKSDVKCRKNLSKATAYCIKSPITQQNFGHSSSTLQEMFGKICGRNINLGNFAAVKILEEVLVVTTS